MTYEQWMGLIRHGLTLAGGILIANGDLNAEQLELWIGAILSAFALGWSYWAKKPVK